MERTNRPTKSIKKTWVIAGFWAPGPAKSGNCAHNPGHRDKKTQQQKTTSEQSSRPTDHSLLSFPAPHPLPPCSPLARPGLARPMILGLGNFRRAGAASGGRLGVAQPDGEAPLRPPLGPAPLHARGSSPLARPRPDARLRGAAAYPFLFFLAEFGKGVAPATPTQWSAIFFIYIYIDI